MDINSTSGNEYEFRIFAENAGGISEPSSLSDRVLAKSPYDPPGAPGNPEKVDTTNDSVTLSWAPPTEDGGSTLIGYRLEMKMVATYKWSPANGDHPIEGTQYTISGTI